MNNDRDCARMGLLGTDTAEKEKFSGINGGEKKDEGCIRRSWYLFKRAFSVIIRNPKLFIFPLVAIVLLFCVALFFLAPFALQDTGCRFTERAHWDRAIQGGFEFVSVKLASPSLLKGRPQGHFQLQQLVRAWLILPLVIMYLLVIFVATFCNVAFYYEAIQALNGQPVSIVRGLDAAFSRIKAITVWSLLLGTVGIVVRVLGDKLGTLGQWVMRVIGIAWGVATVFVIPVIIRDQEKTINPLSHLRSSASILKRTWGESIIGFVGFGFIMLIFGILIVLSSLGIAIAGIAITPSFSWFLVFFLPLEFIIMVLLAFPVTLSADVYKSALYIYATEGVVPAPFDRDSMDSAWKVKNKSR